MPTNHLGWESYLKAAERKLLIAEYHAKCLKELLSQLHNKPEGIPPIPIQAHFEGVIIFVEAAIDQVAQAINSAFRLRLAPANLVGEALSFLGKDIPDLNTWYIKPIGLDLRQIRARIIHYSYVKKPNTDGWEVEAARTKNYSGSRELIAYADSAKDYGNELKQLLPRIKLALS